MQTLPPWNRRFNFGLMPHQQQQDAINRDADLAPATPGIDTVTTFTGRGVIDNRPRTPPGVAMFPVYITSAAGPGALYNGSRLDMSGAIAINPSVGTITPEMVGKSDGTPIYVVNLTELGLSTHDLSVGPVNVVMFAAWWHPLPATDGVRVALTWGFDWFRCSQGVTAAELNFI